MSPIYHYNISIYIVHGQPCFVVSSDVINIVLLIELVCNLEHRNMDMIMFSPNVTRNNYYSDYTYINGIRELRFAQFMERQVQYCWQCPLLVLHSLVVIQ